MGNYQSITVEEENEIIRRVHNKKADKISIDKLSAVIIHLNNMLKQEKTEKLLIAAGSEKLIKDLNFYINKIFWRNYQLKKMKKYASKILRAAAKIGKKIPKDKKWTKKSYYKYLRKMSEWKRIMLNFSPKTNDVPKNFNEDM